MAATPEAKLKRKIKDWLKSNSIWHCSPIGSAYGSSGVPDILCCWQGRFVGIEVKAPGRLSQVTELQKYQISGILAAGGIAAAVDSLDQVKELFRANQT